MADFNYAKRMSWMERPTTLWKLPSPIAWVVYDYEEMSANRERLIEEILQWFELREWIELDEEAEVV